MGVGGVIGCILKLHGLIFNRFCFETRLNGSHVMKPLPNSIAAPCPSLVPARPTGMPRSLVLLFAAASGLSVANVYYAQPLLDVLARDFGISHAAVGGVVTATQAGCRSEERRVGKGCVRTCMLRWR